MHCLNGISLNLLDLLNLLNRLGGHLTLLILQHSLGGWLLDRLCHHHGLMWRLHRDGTGLLLGNGHLLDILRLWRSACTD